MSSKHTPGPWKVFNAWQNGDAVNFSRIGNENVTIITVQNSDDITAFNEANLYLIAAAPELLEKFEITARMVHDTMNSITHGSKKFEECDAYICKSNRELIAKAKGE